MTEPQCTVCDSTEHMQDSHGAGGLNDVCLACFYIWYDGVQPRDDGRVHGEDIRDYCLKARAAGTWPFNGTQLPKPRDAA